MSNSLGLVVPQYACPAEWNLDTVDPGLGAYPGVLVPRTGLYVTDQTLLDQLVGYSNTSAHPLVFLNIPPMGFSDPRVQNPNAYYPTPALIAQQIGAVNNNIATAATNAAAAAASATAAANSAVAAANSASTAGAALPFVSVKASPYNATGNGTTDDTAAIASAIAALPSGGQVYFPTGTYKVSGLNANIANQVWVLGAGATILSTGTTHAISISANHVTIEGPGKIDTSVGSAYSGVFVNSGLFDAFIRFVEIANGTHGVRVKGATGPVTSRVRVHGCTIHDGTGNGVFFNWECTDSQITNNEIYNMGGNGVWTGQNSDRPLIAYNHISNCTGQGIGTNSSGGLYATVVGNIVNVCGAIGISIDTCNGTRVVGNVVVSPGLYGLEAAASNFCVYADNVLISPGGTGISISAASGSCNDNTVANNIVLNPVGNAIYAGGSARGAQRLRILGNYVLDAGNGAGSVVGIGGASGIGVSDWIIANNTVRWTLTASGVSGIGPNGPNMTVSNNLIMHDAGLAASGGTGINIPTSGIGWTVEGNMVEGNGKCTQGMVIAAAVTGLLCATNNITGTTTNMILNNATAATNHFANNFGTRTSGNGFNYGLGTVVGSRDTTEAFQRIQGGVKIGSSATDTLSFYGVAVTAQPAAPATPPALSAVPAGGTGLAAGGWSTAANRDLAITAMNALIATVRDHDAKIRTLGLWA